MPADHATEKESGRAFGQISLKLGSSVPERSLSATRLGFSLANIRAYNLAMFHEARPLLRFRAASQLNPRNICILDDGANLKHTSIRSSWQTAARLLRAFRYCAARL